MARSAAAQADPTPAADPTPDPEPAAQAPVEPELTPDPEPQQEPDPEPAAEPEPTSAAAAPPEDWRDRRIAQLTARLRESERRAAAQEPAQPGTQPIADQAELDRLVEARAAERAAINEFNRQCNETAEAGRKQFGSEFDSRVQGLLGLIDRGDPQDALRYNQFLSAAIETGEAATLLHRLGGDLNEASRIMNLSPVRMGIELARLAAKPEEQVSNAPRPIRPVGGTAGGSRDPIDPADPDRSDRLSTREWMARREAQLARQSQR